MMDPKNVLKSRDESFLEKSHFNEINKYLTNETETLKTLIFSVSNSNLLFFFECSTEFVAFPFSVWPSGSLGLLHCHMKMCFNCLHLIGFCIDAGHDFS